MPTRQTIHRARRLRQEMNVPERAAWETLRQLRRYGYPVRRQHPVGAFIADFAIPKAQLVVEVDGAIHEVEAVSARDEGRQAELEALGWTVLRFTAEEARDADLLWGRVVEQLGL